MQIQAIVNPRSVGSIGAGFRVPMFLSVSEMVAARPMGQNEKQTFVELDSKRQLYTCEEIKTAV